MNSVLKQALTLHQQGQLAPAEQLYRKVLSTEPGNVTALNFLGMLLYQCGDADAALPLLERAVSVDPAHAPAWNNLGLAQRKRQQSKEALASYAQALTLKPDYTEAWINQANALRDVGRPHDAVASCQRALQLTPTSAHAWNTRGAALHDLGDNSQALQCHEKALALAPKMASASFNRGVALTDLGRHEEALQSYVRALGLDPQNAIAWNNCGFVLDSLQRHAEAVAHYAKALALNPSYTEAHVNMGTALDDMGRIDEALLSFSRAVALEPQNVSAHHAQGLCLLGVKRYDEAASALRTVVSLDPQHPYARGHLHDALVRVANWNSSEELGNAILGDVRQGLTTAMPFNLLAIADDAELQHLGAQHYARAASLSAPDQPRPLWHGGAYTHARPRIAYLSADLHDHATAQLMVEVFEHHDREQLDIIALSFGPDRRDTMRDRLKTCFTEFKDVSHFTDAAIAQWMVAHHIDLAVDLKGYTHQSRPGIFAYRGAPVQVNYLGYPGTLGSTHWDYLIGDHVVTPHGAEDHCSEKIVRLPHSYQPNCALKTIASPTPTRAQCGLPETGFVFCCFNDIYKLTPALFNVWMRLLQTLPGSVLWLLSDHPLTQENLQREASNRGVTSERLVFAGRLPVSEHLARLQCADLFLDTLPINAHTTASDALWAGVPVLTCAGRSFASRVAGSLLTAMGLPELIADHLADYEAKARHFAQNTDVLRRLRETLSAQRIHSPLFKPAPYTRALESAYLQMIKRSRAGLPPESFSVPAC